MEKMKRFILVKSDENDADYITIKSPITDEDLEKVREIVSALRVLKPRGGIRWETGERKDKYSAQSYAIRGILTLEETEFLEQYIPCGEHGTHTIESIEIIYQGEKLL